MPIYLGISLQIISYALLRTFKAGRGIAALPGNPLLEGWALRAHRPAAGEQRVSGVPPILKVRICDTALLSHFETHRTISLHYSTH